MDQPPQTINFPLEEKNILEYWDRIKPLELSLQQSKDKPRFGFYDGPPFATGLPHYGHILAGTIKDIITRFAHQNGYHVERRFGWDCHGLPIEYEIDKMLEIKSPDQVLAMGIDKYNDECRKIVMRYSSEWRHCINRLGRWIDFDNDYKTLYPWFMESVWWVFKQFFNKGLVYRGFKVMPFSTACHTPLSNFESGLNYKDVTDPAVTAEFPLDDEPDVSLLAWTTTPWTYPSNTFLCVNENLSYVKVLDETTRKKYIVGESRLPIIFKNRKYQLLDTFKGERLKGKTYAPLFPYFAHMKKRGFFCVLSDNYVSEEAGTGVVSQAPYFGEDDYRCALESGILNKDDEEIVCPIDDSGCFMEPVTDFKGMYVKDADKHVIKYIKDVGRLFHQNTINHNYPFCWRSETPLIYRAVPSWFIRVEKFKQNLLDNNAQTYWVPNFVKDKRFANWLKDARDWAISRNRYWGTPIPIWISEDGLETYCVGSMEELQRLTGKNIKDIHRENVDDILIPSCRPGCKPLKRVTDVFDCWFESGSMPYAQMHYPFQDKDVFEKQCFPADFIAEGIDQTRGWFYTLLVVSTLLFGQPPFKNLIVNGLVLAGDGQKMSKRKKNYPDPLNVIHKYGADALRLYLINSPVVRGEFLRFKEEHVFDILKEAFLPWYNAYRFLIQNIELWQKNTGGLYVYEGHIDTDTITICSTNIMDLWILSYTNSLIQFFYWEMEKYHLFTVVPKLFKFIDNLTNWYVRFNRKRLKGETGYDDARVALDTLYTVIFSLCRMMAPFTPFLTEYMYQNLKKVLAQKSDDNLSIHLLMLPKPNQGLINKDIERSVEYMQMIIELGRLVRDRKNLPIKYPLNEVVVIHGGDDALEREITLLEDYIVQELNVKKLTLSSDRGAYNVKIKVEPDHKILGAKYKSTFKTLAQAIKDLSDAELVKLQKEEKLMIAGCEVLLQEVRILYTFDSASQKSYEAASNADLLVLMDVSPDESMIREGYAREIINRIQKLRKKAKLLPLDDITVYFTVLSDKPDIGIGECFQTFHAFISDTIKQDLRLYPLEGLVQPLVIEEENEIKGCLLKLAIVAHNAKPDVLEPSKLHNGLTTVPSTHDEGQLSGYINQTMTIPPFFNLIYVRHNHITSFHKFDPKKDTAGLGVIFLNDKKVAKAKIENQIRTLFNIHGKKLTLYLSVSDASGGEYKGIVRWKSLGENTMAHITQNKITSHVGNIFVFDKDLEDDIDDYLRCSCDTKSFLPNPVCQYVRANIRDGQNQIISSITLLRENPQKYATLQKPGAQGLLQMVAKYTQLCVSKLSIVGSDEANSYVTANFGNLDVDLTQKTLNILYR